MQTEPGPASVPVASASSGATSLSMLERVQSNDADAWRRLVQLYSPLIYSWCRHGGLKDADAADLMQEVWRSVAGHVGRFERGSGGAFRGWLWTITRNKLRDYFRARQGKPEAIGGSEARDRLQAIPEEEPAESAPESQNLLHRALDMIRGDFEEHTWKAFWRTTVDGIAAAEAAREFAMEVDAVYQAKSRVLRRLREEMKGLID
jgi:RNA polymerase sigma-70 factor, ECF subfamily